MKYLTLILIFLPISACFSHGQGRETCKEMRKSEEVSLALPPILSPLRLGMSHEAIRRALSNHEEILVMVGPSSILSGGKGKLPNAVECTYAIKEDTVVFISTDDARVYVDGLGIKSSFEDIRQTDLHRKTLNLMGYGTLVSLTPTAWLAFPYSEQGAIELQLRANNIQFRNENCQP